MAATRIAVVGGGPVGLEAALYARTLGHEVALFERGEVAGNVAAWGFVQLFTPWSMVTTHLGLRAIGRQSQSAKLHQDDYCPGGAEYREQYLLPLAASAAMKGVVRPNTSVLAIGREDYGREDAFGQAVRATSPFRLLVKDSAERVEHADVVLDCSGTYGNHRWAGKGGIPAVGEQSLASRMWYRIPDVLGRDRGRFADRHTLLLGAGPSAATTLLYLKQLAEKHAKTRVTWALRRWGQLLQSIDNDPLPQRRHVLESALRLATAPPPWLTVHDNCITESVAANAHFAVSLRQEQATLSVTADEVVAMLGYVPDESIYHELLRHPTHATAGPMKLAAALLVETGDEEHHAPGAEMLKNPEPGFFILGAKSYGLNSAFLVHTGHKQIRDAFRLIEDRGELDLYM